jgi:hypothetical protein
LATVSPVQDQAEEEQPELTPLDPENIGKYASFDVSPEPMYGPDELGKDMVGAIDDLSEAVTKSDSAPRIYEVLQAWEQRLFDRNYQFNLCGAKGFGMFGSGSPMQIMAAGNTNKLFSANVFGARKKKITAVLSRDVPTLKFMPADPDSPPDQTMADESEKYVEVWKQDTDAKNLTVEIGGLFYTDDRVALWTRSVADQQRWGTDPGEAEPVGYGAPETEGISPETELQPDGAPSDRPAICEITTAYGKLEHKVPLIADEESEMGWVRISKEINVNIAKERYSWIEDKISAGSGLTTGNDQFDRLARMNVRLAVQNSSVTGESWLSDVTETHTWYRPSQYRQVKDKDTRQLFYNNFPDGLRVTHIGSQLAFARNESVNDHIKILHSCHGSGQNRSSIGTNYLPLQKVVNQNISLLNRYFVGGVPRRFHDIAQISSEAINSWHSDPQTSTGIDVPAGKNISDATGMEAVAAPTPGLVEYLQWLIEVAPEIMDGGSDAIFGTEDADTFGEAKLNRDAALQVFGTPWSQICWGLAGAAQQAAACAAKNRTGNIRSRVPGAGRLTIQVANMKGNALCYPESVDIPETLADQEARMGAMIDKSPTIPLYQGIVNDPLNLVPFKNIARFAGLTMPGVDAVEKQQGEFELMMQSGPLDNPLYMQLEQQIQMVTQQVQMAEGDMEAATPEGQAALQQLQQQLQQDQQQLQQTPPKISSVQVAQDGSENHAVEAAITLSMLNSEEGRKLKNGTPDQQAIYQNLLMHWQGHEQMKSKLAPVPPLPVKANASVAIDKLPPDVQAQALQAMGVKASPEDFHSQDMLIPRETIVEKEGVDAQGVPIKTKTSMASPKM